MNNDACIKHEVNDHIAVVTIHQPARRNAVCAAMWDELFDTLTRLESEDVRCLVLRGAGDKAFSAGADISEFATLRATPELAAHQDLIAKRALNALGDFKAPTLARIEGACIGGGLELALRCDLRFADANARFGVTPARLGLGYNLHDTSVLVDRLGVDAARELLFTARIVDAEDAQRLRIVSGISAPGEIDSLVQACADDIARNAPLTVGASKKIINEASKPEAERNAAMCDEWVRACNASADFLEGQDAFAKKRTPQFVGR